MIAAAENDQTATAATLVLADWFEEQYDIRAELIRANVALRTGRLANRPIGLKERQYLRCRVSELQKKCERIWLDELNLPMGCQIVLYDGVPTLVRLGLDALVLNWRSLRDALPTLQGAHLVVTRTDDFGSLAIAPPFQDLKSLIVDTQGEALSEHSSLMRLLCPKLTAVESLDLSRLRGLSGNANEGLHYLATAPFVSKLRHLNLRGARVTATDLHSLFDATCWHNLRSLDVSGNPIGDSGIEILAVGNKFPALESLFVDGCDLLHDSADIIASRAFPSLKMLDISHNQIGGFGLRRLLEKASASGLQHLAAACCEIMPGVLRRALEIVGDIPINLRSLALSGNRLDSSDVTAIAHRGQFPHLETLDLRANELSVESLHTILDSTSLGKLSTFHAAYNRLASETLRSVARCYPSVAIPISENTESDKWSSPDLATDFNPTIGGR